MVVLATGDRPPSSPSEQKTLDELGLAAPELRHLAAGRSPYGRRDVANIKVDVVPAESRIKRSD